MAILAILIPVAPQFLRLANTPEEFIEEGTVYFILELVSLVIIFLIMCISQLSGQEEIPNAS